jgi:hypothetical protein
LNADCVSKSVAAWFSFNEYKHLIVNTVTAFLLKADTVSAKNMFLRDNDITILFHAFKTEISISAEKVCLYETFHFDKFS